MQRIIGLRREETDAGEQRAPLAPQHVRRLSDDGLVVHVQPSARRIFSDADYAEAGALLTRNLREADVILGVKEVPVGRILPDIAYCFFSHTIKGQSYNMPMLRRILELGSTLIDYERITDDQGRRLVFFGRYAGVAGMIRSLWAWGKRMAWEGIVTPFRDVRRAFEYPSLEAALDGIREIGRRIRQEGLPGEVVPFICGFAGYGNVSRGAQEVFDLLPVREVAPEELEGLVGGGESRTASTHEVYKVIFREEHIVRPKEAGRRFDLQEYYHHPEGYEGTFDRYYPLLSLLVNATYWSPRYPRLVTRELLAGLYRNNHVPRPRVIGDISCDIGGSIECTVRTTTLGQPVFVWDPLTGDSHRGWAGRGPVVMAVDRLPNEFARESASAFGEALMPLLPTLARAELDRPFDRLELPSTLQRAMIVHRGTLTPDYRYLEPFVEGRINPHQPDSE